MKRNALLLLSLGLSLVIPGLSTTIVVDPNPPVSATSISSQVTGADLAGLVMTATYNTPGAPTAVTSVWMPTGPNSGAAGNFAVSVSVTGNAGDPFAWQYSSTFLSPLVSLVFDGSAAGIYFDRAHAGPGTPGSGPGADITFSPLSPAGVENQVVVTYAGAVSVNGAPPQNDLYAQLRISFAAIPLGGLVPQGFTFTQPVDRTVTPEPASFRLLLLAGVAVLAFAGLGTLHRL